MSALPDVRDREVLVLGLGASGLAMARWCQRLGARVTVADSRAEPPQAAALRAELPQVRLLQAAFDGALFAQGDWVAVGRSPGLAPAQTEALERAARQASVPVLGELAWFAGALDVLARREPDPYRPQLLAITGTNGKTTVTQLTAHLLRHAGVAVAVAGNIGPTMLDVLGAHMDAGTLPEAWVLELSSFQLHGIQDFEPSAATLLNLSEDHLDWHGDMQAYAEDKARIFGRRGLMVLNRNDAHVMACQPKVEDGAKGRKRAVERAWCSFGADLPARAGDWGLESVHGMRWLVRAVPVDDTPRRGRAAADADEWLLQRLMPAEALRIHGRHNACNALAALALASSTSAPLAAMLHGLREYRGEPHRVESVAIVHDVEYFDDSKGTNVGATLAAIEGLGAERRLLLILGGEGKGQDFSPLAAPLARHARAVALIGRDAPALRTVLEPLGLPLLDAPDMGQAVRWLAAQAQAGDAVLLSPACASLDQYRDYVHRAEVFCAAVQDLQLDAGVSA